MDAWCSRAWKRAPPPASTPSRAPASAYINGQFLLTIRDLRKGDRPGKMKMTLQLLEAIIIAVALVAAVAEGFTVTGEVYCDPCRAGFKTNVSTPAAGAAVKLECRPFLNGPESLKADATTDAFGWYKLEVDEDLQEDICEVMLVKSPDPTCSEIDKFRDRARIPLTKNNGIKQNGVRYGNPIAFLRKEPLKDCGLILQQYDLMDAPETP